KVVAKLGEFRGINRDGTPDGLLFPASPVIVGKELFVTNLAIALTAAVGDEPEEDVKLWTVSKLKLPHCSSASLHEKKAPLARGLCFPCSLSNSLLSRYRDVGAHALPVRHQDVVRRAPLVRLERRVDRGERAGIHAAEHEGAHAAVRRSRKADAVAPVLRRARVDGSRAWEAHLHAYVADGPRAPLDDPLY